MQQGFPFSPIFVRSVFCLGGPNDTVVKQQRSQVDEFSTAIFLISSIKPSVHFPPAGYKRNTLAQRYIDVIAGNIELVSTCGTLHLHVHTSFMSYIFNICTLEIIVHFSEKIKGFFLNFNPLTKKILQYIMSPKVLNLHRRGGIYEKI